MRVCALVCGQVLLLCAVCVGAQCIRVRGGGVGWGGGAASGSWAGGLGPEAGRRVQAGAPCGSLLWWPPCLASSRIPAGMQRGACVRESAPARRHLSGSLGGGSHPPPTLRGSRS